MLLIAVVLLFTVTVNAVRSAAAAFVAIAVVFVPTVVVRVERSDAAAFVAIAVVLAPTLLVSAVRSAAAALVPMLATSVPCRSASLFKLAEISPRTSKVEGAVPTNVATAVLILVSTCAEVSTLALSAFVLTSADKVFVTLVAVFPFS